jgi:hypothetical protein
MDKAEEEEELDDDAWLVLRGTKFAAFAAGLKADAEATIKAETTAAVNLMLNGVNDVLSRCIHVHHKKEMSVACSFTVLTAITAIASRRNPHT